ncbi:hypothetical protein MHYP_G00164980 [Metynnis hypsauchen]
MKISEALHLPQNIPRQLLPVAEPGPGATACNPAASRWLLHACHGLISLTLADKTIKQRTRRGVYPSTTKEVCTPGRATPLHRLPQFDILRFLAQGEASE